MMEPTNFWEVRALDWLRAEAPEVERRLADDGALEDMVRRAVAAAMDVYVGLIAEGTNADAAREVAMAQLHEEIVGRGDGG